MFSTVSTTSAPSRNASSTKLLKTKKANPPLVFSVCTNGDEDVKPNTVVKTEQNDISVVFGASGINQSPFRMVAQPARRHLGKSIPTGQSLTLATAGVQASVTITVKDRHDNWQPDPSVTDADVKFGITDVATHQPTNVVQDLLLPDDIPSFTDKVSYIGPSTNAGYQVSTPTDLFVS